MPYCVNCGVELSENAVECPLCQTPVWHPPESVAGPAYFPTKPTVVKRESKRALAILLSAMLFSAAFCCGIVNVIFPTEHFWAFYVIGAAMMLWVWIVLPLLMRRAPTFLKLTLDVAAVGVYVYLISVGVHGSTWFVGLALPILGVACVEVFLLSFFLREHRRSLITAICLCVGAVGLFAIGVGWSIDRFLVGHGIPGWSLVVLVVCVALIIPLRIIRRVPSLRESVRRLFNM